MFRAPALLAIVFLAAVARVNADETRPIWLVSNGFHTSVAVRVRDMPRAVRELTNDRRADHLLIGWGAAVFYQARRVNLLVFCRATFLPTPSALHVLPFHGRVSQRFAHSDVVRFDVSPADLARAAGFLSRSVRRDSSGQPILLGPGHLPGSRFYAGRDTFWFPATCNVWCARVLRQAGLPFGLAKSIAASEVVWQSRELGRREQVLSAPLDAF